MTSDTPSTQPAEMDPAPDRKSWQNGIGPRYMALFLSILFFDRLAPTTLQVGGLAPALLGALVAGLLAFSLLYEVPALLGVRTRLTLMQVSERTFGRTGARLVPGVVLGLLQVVWFAVAIAYALQLSLQALAVGRLLDPELLAPIVYHGRPLPGFVFQGTAVLWLLSAAMLGPLLVNLVAAVMYAYIVFPAVAFGGLMIWALGGLADYRPPPSDPASSWRAFTMMVQLIFGYFATAGLGAVGWGAISRSRRDIHLGGLTGVVLASVMTVSIALVTVAGSLGRRSITTATYSAVLGQGIGGRLGCVLLMIFALSLLGPACYMPTEFGRSFQNACSRTKRWGWWLLGAVLAWPLVATGLALRLELMFGLVGAAAAPIAGALAADFVRDRGDWPGPRRGINPSGLCAWLVGLAIGLVPYLGPARSMPGLAQIQPAAVYAFLVAFAVQFVLRAFRIETTTEQVPSCKYERSLNIDINTGET